MSTWLILFSILISSNENFRKDREFKVFELKLPIKCQKFVFSFEKNGKNSRKIYTDCMEFFMLPVVS